MKEPPITEITRPVLAGNYPRNRLFRMMDRNRDKPALWVCGPAGSGKTTLVSSYIEARNLRCVWYLVDRGDADVATLFHYLELAAERISPRSKKKPSRPAPAHPSGSQVTALTLFDGLFGRMVDPTVVVFDNCHNLPADSPFFEVLRDGLSRLYSGVRFILISRDSPSPVFSRMRTHGLMDLIGWQDLRVSFGETKGIARQWKRGSLRTESIQYLQSRTDGWAAGVVLLLAKAARDGIEPHRLSRHPPQEIFDYFGAEMFENLGTEIRDFLLRSAFLPRMTTLMAERLTGNRRAGRILSYLNQRNYFTEMYPGEAPVFRYHGLFRDFLVSRARERFSAQEISRIRRKAAAVLEEHGQAEHAVELFRQAGDLGELARVIGAQASSLIRQGRTKTLLDWLGHIPEETVKKDPWLLYWKGLCRLGHEPSESRALMEKAHAGFRAKKDIPGEFLACAGVIEAILYEHDEFSSLDSWFDAVESLLQQHKGSFPSAESEARVTCSMIKGMVFRCRGSSLRKKWEARARALARESADPAVKAEILVNLAFLDIEMGLFGQAETTLQSLKPFWKHPDVSPLNRVAAAFAEGAFANKTGQYDRCLEATSSALSYSATTGVRVMDFLLTGQAAFSLFNKGCIADAQKHLRSMGASLASARPWGAAFFHYLSGFEALHRKHAADAAFHSDRCLRLRERAGNHHTLMEAQLLCAVVSGSAGKEEKAAANLARAVVNADRTGSPHDRFTCMMVKAYLFLISGKEEPAVDTLRSVMPLGRKHGFHAVCLWIPGFYETIAAKALEAGIETAYAEELIRKRNLLPDASAIGLENWPWPVRVHMFGGFAIVRDGKPVPFSRKGQQKPLLMLKALIAMGGREVPEERITDILWPNAEGDLGHQSFATNLRRLRKILGNEKSVLLNEGRVTLNSRYCWVDVWAFERIVGLIDRGETDGSVPGGEAKTARLLEKAIGLYHGAFLADDAFCPCIETTRERLRSMFLRCVTKLCLYREAAGEWGKAVDCCRRGLEVEDLAEEFYRCLIAGNIRQGKNAEALAAYHRLRKNLSTVLGVLPSRETEALCKPLLPG